MARSSSIRRKRPASKSRLSTQLCAGAGGARKLRRTAGFLFGIVTLFCVLPVLAEDPERAPAPVKRLEATNIEGEVHLPQVLFITSRESVRPLDFLDFYADLATQTLLDGIEIPGEITVIPLDDEPPVFADAPLRFGSGALPHATAATGSTAGISARWKDSAAGAPEVSVPPETPAGDGVAPIDPEKAQERHPPTSASPPEVESKAHISQREESP
jgi:hypothetical protein